MAPGKYEYSPLVSQDAIRILYLLPATYRDSPVHLRLHEVPFLFEDDDSLISQLPTYRALSYVWLAGSGHRPIYCNGKQILITKNCESALKHLRRFDLEQALWVDSICINQDSEKERSHQVQLMWQIYRQAQQVIIWLGPGNALTCETFTSIRDWVSSTAEESEESGTVPATKQISRQMYGLFNNAYFRRVWTIQEVLSNASKVIVCGKHSISWDVFISASRIFVKHEQQANRNPYYVFEGKEQIQQLLCEKYDNCFASMSPQFELSPVDQCEPRYQLSIRELLNIASTHECQDPRDKVFAFRGIYRLFGVHLPESHYENPHSVVLAQAVRSVIKDTRSLACLEWNLDNNECSHETSEQSSKTVSWVPQLQLLSWRCLNPRLYSSRGWRAAADSHARVDLLSNTHELELHLVGLHYGTVRKVGLASFKFDGDGRLLGKAGDTQLQQVEAIFQDWMKLAKSDSTRCSSSQEEPVMALLGILLEYGEAQIHGMSIFQRHLDPESLSKSHTKSELRAVGSEMTRFEDSFSFKSKDKTAALRTMFARTVMYNLRRQERFFITQKGHYGIGPTDLESHDEIVIFAGASQPMAIRKDNQSYRFVGNVYVHGIMKGEVWPEDETSLKTYVLV